MCIKTWRRNSGHIRNMKSESVLFERSRLPLRGWPPPLRLEAQEVGSTSTRVRHEQDVKNSQRHQPGVFAKGRCPSMPEKKAFPITWYPPTSMMDS